MTFSTFMKKYLEDNDPAHRREVFIKALNEPYYVDFSVKDLFKEDLADKDFALALVERNGRFLQNVSEELQADEDVCWKAVKNEKTAIASVKGRMATNKEIHLYVSANEDILPYVHYEMKNKEWFIKSYFKFNPTNWYNDIPDKKEMLLKIIRESSVAYKIEMLDNIQSQAEHFWNLGSVVFKEALSRIPLDKLNDITPSDEYPIKTWIEDRRNEPLKQIEKEDLTDTNKTSKKRKLSLG